MENLQFWTFFFTNLCLLFFSAHGTFIGSIRLEGKKPQQVPIDSEIHFGASTRKYIIRERPQTIQHNLTTDEKTGEEIEGGLLGLPETETELDVSVTMWAGGMEGGIEGGRR